MSDPDPFKMYLQMLQRSLSTGAATEHTHRPALQHLLEALGDGVSVINEPKRVECGAPDYIITRAHTPIGYVEAKDVGTSLEVAEWSEQMQRYRASLNNLILTDYLEFRWYVEKVEEEKPPTPAADKAPGPLRAVMYALPFIYGNEAPVEVKPEPKPEPRPTGRVYINKTQYFEGIEPDVWAFQIGGYQVLHKWLKDRKGRRLTFNDMFHYQKIVVALKETMRLMGEIDDLISSWPIE